jgi:N-dimethylarginine dimethylaminohydrolase
MAKFRKKLLRDIYVKWANKYMEQYMKHEEKYWRCNDYHFIYSSLEFCRDYIEHLHKRGKTLKFVQDFLDLQTPKGKRGKYTIQFEQGYPVTAFAYVNQLSDMDFLAAKMAIFYKEIYIYNKNSKDWNEGEAEEIIEMVRKNLVDDGNKVKIKKTVENGVINLDTRVFSWKDIEKLELR